MGTKRVVLDTNIFISALGWNGKPKRIFEQCIDGKLELITSPEQMNELRRVMEYPKFNFTEDQKERLVSIIMEIATMVEIFGKVNIIKDDPDDNMIVETAIVGNAGYIVTGDPHLLQLKEFAKIRIVTANDFLEAEQ